MRRQTSTSPLLLVTVLLCTVSTLALMVDESSVSMVAASSVESEQYEYDYMPSHDTEMIELHGDAAAAAAEDEHEMNTYGEGNDMQSQANFVDDDSSIPHDALSEMYSSIVSSSMDVSESESCYTWSPDELAFRRLHNLARQPMKRQPLQFSAALSALAKLNTERMMKAGKVLHTDEDVLKNSIMNWKVIGENVGLSSDSKATIQQLWMAYASSPRHMQNVVSDEYTHVGISVMRSRLRDEYETTKSTPPNALWATVLFSGSVKPDTNVAGAVECSPEHPQSKMIAEEDKQMGLKDSKEAGATTPATTATTTPAAAIPANPAVKHL